MKVNNLIKILTFSDVLIVSGWGLTNPLFAVYINKQIIGGSFELIGFATCAYWVARSVMLLPVAKLIDSIKGEIDDFLVMALGSLMMCLVPFLYYFWASRPPHVILLQALYGFSTAMVSPAWLAIFTRHIDKHIEAEEWGLYSSMVGVGAALSGALGGFMAEKFGIKPLFLIVGIICLFGNAFLFFVYQDLRMAEAKIKNKVEKARLELSPEGKI